MSGAEEIETLILLVRDFPCIFDLRHPCYKDTVKKAQAWKEIAEKLNQTSDSVKCKWKNLRDTYVRYVKSLKKGTGLAKKFKHWPWATSMEFLKDTVTPRPTVSNVHEPQVPEDESEEDELSNTNTSSVIIDPVSVANDDAEVPPPPKKPKGKEVKTSDVDKLLTYFQYKRDKKCNSELDRIDHLFLSYAETFKKLSPRTQAEVKMEMAQMFGRAELRDMDAPTHSSFSTASNTSWSSSSGPSKEENYNNIPYRLDPRRDSSHGSTTMANLETSYPHYHSLQNFRSSGHSSTQGNYTAPLYTNQPQSAIPLDSIQSSIDSAKHLYETFIEN